MTKTTLALVLSLATAMAAGCSRKPASIQLNPQTLKLSKKGATQSVTATVSDENGKPIEDALVDWTSSDAAVASVSAGTVQAVSSGMATITARAGAVSKDLRVTVSIPASIVIDPPALNFAAYGEPVPVGGTVMDEKGNRISDATIEWSVADPAIATVNEGAVTALADGSTQLVARSGEVTGTAAIQVLGPKPRELKLDRDVILVKVGESEQVQAIVKDEAGTVMANPKLLWSAGNPAIATIDETGKVTGVARGETSITCQAGDVQAAMKVKVR